MTSSPSSSVCSPLSGADGQPDERRPPPPNPAHARHRGAHGPQRDGHRAGGLAAPHHPDAQVQHRHRRGHGGDQGHHGASSGENMGRGKEAGKLPATLLTVVGIEHQTKTCVCVFAHLVLTVNEE